MFASMRSLALTVAVSAFAASHAGIASAEPDLFSRQTVHGRLDMRTYASEAEANWLDKGFGRTRFGEGEADAGLDIGNAALVWRPRLTWSVDGYAHLQANPGQYNGVDLVEAFLRWKPMPHEGVRYSVRGGMFFPPISLEHDGVAWTPTRTITPSAINSWIGEEVLVLGLEGAAEKEVAGHRFGLTAAAFQHNDTSGTLLTYRGWAMHDVLATAFGDFDIPTRGPVWNAFYATQAPTTEPTREVDGRWGSYVRLDWAPPGTVSFNALYYDNHGNPEVVEEGQYGWRTRFVNVGMAARLGENTELLTQFMTGETVMGHQMPVEWMADVGFTSAYVLLSHRMGANTAAGRLDWFEVDDRTFEAIDDNNEEGWAATLAYQRQLGEGFSVALEGLYIDSDKPARADQALDPRQRDTQLQMAVRWDF